MKILLVDDHEIVRRGLRMTIQGEEDMQLIGEAANGKEALALLERSVPDLLLLDLQMPIMDGVETARAVKARYPQVYVMVLTSFDGDDKLHAALQAGVDGYFLKDTPGDELVAAMRAAQKGKPLLHPDIARKLMARMPAPSTPLDELSERERAVLQLLARGLSNKEIGHTLHLSEQTIKGYVSTILAKLHIADRTQAALLAVRYGLVRIEEL